MRETGCQLAQHRMFFSAPQSLLGFEHVSVDARVGDRHGHRQRQIFKQAAVVLVEFFSRRAKHAQQSQRHVFRRQRHRQQRLHAGIQRQR